MNVRPKSFSPISFPHQYILNEKPKLSCTNMWNPSKVYPKSMETLESSLCSKKKKEIARLSFKYFYRISLPKRTCYADDCLPEANILDWERWRVAFRQAHHNANISLKVGRVPLLRMEGLYFLELERLLASICCACDETLTCKPEASVIEG